MFFKKEEEEFWGFDAITFVKEADCLLWSRQETWLLWAAILSRENAVEYLGVGHILKEPLPDESGKKQKKWNGGNKKLIKELLFSLQKQRPWRRF